MSGVVRDVVVVDGPDAESFLQGQLSQDVAALAEGDGAPSFLLQPTGKVDALLRVRRESATRFVLDVDPGYGDAVAARLTRFKLRVKCEVAAAGPQELDAPWGSGDRVAAGWPAMGAELDEKTIPGETGLVAAAASFTKGCYTGQELVARIDSRGGNVPRHLRHVRLAEPGAAGSAVPVGAVVEVGGQSRGVVTSVAGDGALALAYVHRDVEPPAKAVLRWDGGEAAGTIEAIAR